MKPVHPPRSLHLLVLPLAAAVVLLGACGDDEAEPAAVVDGVEITPQSVVDELEAIAANPDYLDALEQNSGPVLGDEEGTFDSAFAAQVLARQIQYTIVSNEVARRELVVDDACREAAENELVEGLAGVSPDGDGSAVYEAFPESYRDQLVGWNADVLALRSDLAGQSCVDDDAVEAYFDEHEGEFTEVCAHHILVETAEEAAAVKAELAAGADFATLASQRSTDTGSGAQGGDLGCAVAGTYVPEFQDAVLTQAVGEVGDPVQSQFGYHVIRVDSREDPALDDVRDQVVAALANDAQSGFGEWFNGALVAADVTVDSRYGTWDAANAQITPPASGDDDTSETTAPSDSTTTTSG